MANSSKGTPKAANITEFPAADSSVAVAEQAEPRDTGAESPEPVAQTVQPVPKGPGRPKKTDESPQSDFFQQVAAVRSTDWGTRIYLYLYQLEPVCDLKKSGGKAYLMRYEEPITDEHRIMIEQGSGRYRFILAKNKISADASNELARYEFEIYNRLYPPKLNREAWVPDPRNRRWEVLLPKEPTPQPAAGATDSVLEGIRLGNEIRKEAREELRAEAPAATTPATPTAIDPWTAAEKILNMRSENPMAEFMKAQMQLMHTSMESERTRAFQAAESARQREFELQKQLLEAKYKPVEQSKGLLDQVFEMAADDTKMERVRKIAGLFGLGDGGGRAPRTTPLDVVREVVNSPFGSQLGQGLGTLLTNLTQPAAATPNGNTAPAPTLNPAPPGAPVTHETDTQKIARIAQAVTRVMIEEYFDQGDSAEDFAIWMDNGHPDDLEFLRKLGADTLVNLYQQHNPQLWQHLTAHPQMGNREQKFRAFVRDVLAWNPEAETESAPTSATRDTGDGFEPQGEDES
jgi:hypothetical protein